MDFQSPMMEQVAKSGVEITATLQCKYKVNGKWKLEKCYHGKSSRRVTKKQNPEDVLRQNKEEMTKVAERAALQQCFREGLGFTKFKDMVIDELNRPMNV